MAQILIKPRIAVVEDDPYMRDLLIDYLESRYEVDSFENPKVFIEHCERDSVPYSLILSDYNLPEMSGGDLIKALVNFKLAIPVLLISAASEMNSLTALSLGADAFLKKPFRLSDLATAIHGLTNVNSPKTGEAT